MSHDDLIDQLKQTAEEAKQAKKAAEDEIERLDKDAQGVRTGASVVLSAIQQQRDDETKRRDELDALLRLNWFAPPAATTAAATPAASAPAPEPAADTPTPTKTTDPAETEEKPKFLREPSAKEPEEPEKPKPPASVLVSSSRKCWTMAQWITAGLLGLIFGLPVGINTYRLVSGSLSGGWLTLFAILWIIAVFAAFFFLGGLLGSLVERLYKRYKK